jgi:hypothetical protein
MNLTLAGRRGLFASLCALPELMLAQAVALPKQGPDHCRTGCTFGQLAQPHLRLQWV